jgi:hypothetical protein
MTTTYIPSPLQHLSLVPDLFTTNGQKINDIYWCITYFIPTRTQIKLLHTGPVAPSFLLLGKPYKPTKTQNAAGISSWPTK